MLIPAPPSAVFVRFYGADGTLLGIDPGPAGHIDICANLTPVFGTHEEGVEAHTEARLAPTPDQPDRLRTLACVDVANRWAAAASATSESENALVVMGSCGAPDLVGGIVAADVVSVRLTLGSGAHSSSRARVARGVRRAPRDRRAAAERRGGARRHGARRRRHEVARAVGARDPAAIRVPGQINETIASAGR